MFFMKKMNDPVRSRLKDRHYLEHVFLPAEVLGWGGSRVIDSVTKKKGDYFISLLQKRHRFNRNYQCPYSPEQFQVKEHLMEDALGRTCTIIQVTMPDTEEAMQCARLYLCHDGKKENRRYFTVEKTREGGFLLCEWFRFAHAVHGVASSHVRKELKTVMGIYLSGDAHVPFYYCERTSRRASRSMISTT